MSLNQVTKKRQSTVASIICPCFKLLLFKASIHAQDVPLIYFDYHSECRGGKVDRIEKIKPKLEDVVKQHNFFLKVNINAFGFGSINLISGTERFYCQCCMELKK